MNILLLIIALLAQPCDLSAWQTVMDTLRDSLIAVQDNPDSDINDVIAYQFTSYSTLDELATLELDECGYAVQLESIRLVNAMNESVFAGIANLFASEPSDIEALEDATYEQLAVLNEALETVGWEAFVLPESPE